MADFSALGFEGTAPVQLAKLANLRGQADLTQAQAEEQQLKNKQAKALQGYMQQAAAGMGVPQESLPSGDDMPRMVATMSVLAAKAGDAVLSGKLAADYSTMLSQEAIRDRSAIEAEKTAQATQWDQLVKLEQILSPVYDQDSFDQANAKYAEVFKKPSPYMGKRYEDVAPQLDVLSQQVMTAQDQLRERAITVQEEEHTSKDARRKRQAEHYDVMERLAEEADARAEGRKATLKKNGGKVIGAPSARESEIAYPLVKAAMPDLESDELRRKTDAVAGLAKELTIKHPGLRFEEAAKQALTKISRVPGVDFQDGSKPSQALPFPADMKVEQGKYYNTSRGVGKAVPGGIELLPSGIDFDKMYNTDEQLDTEE